jgi:MraZ protein
MSQFLGTHQNRLDAKGRVSVPAQFRTALRAAATGDGTASLILRPSHQHPCVEAWPVAAFQALATPLDRLDVFSQAHDDLATALYGDAFPMEADKEGRIVVPEQLVAHAGLTGAVTFVGMGRIFHIWEPTAFARRREEARERARLRELAQTGAAAA